jgi:hypothetical protein
VVAQQPTFCGRAAETGAIKVYVKELDQLFNSLDPSPFHEKDLDRNAHEYIVSTARELPGCDPAVLLVYLEKPEGIADDPRLLADAVRIHFARRAELLRRELRQLLRRGWVSLLIGVTFLLTSVLVGQAVARHFGYGPLATVVRESLIIGGWVAMWRPMEILLYDYWALRREQRIYQRLSRVDVRIVYTGSDSAPRVAPGTPAAPAAAGVKAGTARA